MPETASRVRRAVRGRLLAIALIPFLALMPLLIGVSMQRWILRTDQILAARVTSDLTVARQYLSHLTDSTGQKIGAIAATPGVADRTGWLGANRAQLGLDFLWLETAPETSPDPGSPVLAAAWSGRAESALEVLAPAQLDALAPGLSLRAQIAVMPTQASAPDTKSEEARGLVILAATPVRLADGRRAVLAGGILLNRNARFIDGISRLVYPATDPELSDRSGPQIDPALDRGIITLFLGDVRISTTLRDAQGTRAIGTRASQAVRDRVLIGGGSWHDTALVVNAWYISAYEPLLDSRGTRVGMLYAGIPAAPYIRARWVSWSIIGGTFLALTLFTVPLFLHWARGIFRPIEAMGATIARVDAGDGGARTGPVRGAAEIARLSQHLDGFLDRLATREQELRTLNADLNSRVEARTEELSRANLALETASRQLVLSEKLATIGEVTAGVAHEINNPLAVIQGNLEVLRMVMDERAAEASTEFALIEAQLARIGALVGRLLQFARPEEFEDSGGATDPRAVLAEIQPLIQHLLDRGHVRFETEIEGAIPLRINRLELAQILVNLATNAVQAMPQGGDLRIEARAEPSQDGRAGLRFRITDTGKGMDAAVQTRIFDPFFTTRGRDGTGLGLAICQMLVTRQEGTIRVESTPGKGSTFDFWLPAADPVTDVPKNDAVEPLRTDTSAAGATEINENR